MKKKTRLALESLAVESFDTSPAAPVERGTVRGHDSATGPEEPDTLAASCGCTPGTNFTACGQATCAWTCDPACTAATAGNSCGHTCVNTCYYVCGPEEPR